MDIQRDENLKALHDCPKEYKKAAKEFQEERGNAVSRIDNLIMYINYSHYI